MCGAAVTLNGFTLGYEKNIALNAVSGSFLKGSLTAVVGPNGSGKSTLMKGIAGILPSIAGSCALFPGARIAYLPQSSELDRSFPATVKDLVALGLWHERGLLRRHSSNDSKRISNALISVGLGGYENTSINELSGGQFQRALFARVIVQDASIILLDEPFNAIDAANVQELLAIIKIWHIEKRTIIVVIHDPLLVKEHFPETMMINEALITWGKTDEVLNEHSLSKPFFS